MTLPPTPPTSVFEIHLLGGFQLRPPAPGGDRFESQKVRALLAYLLCQPGRRLSRDHLADLLWPERSPEAARRNLRQALYNLRCVLATEGRTGHELIDIGPQSLTVSAGGYWLDVAAFEEAVRRGMRHADAPDVEPLERAAALYRGDFLAGFHVRDSPVFEEWQLGEQERLRELALQVLKVLTDRRASQGDHRQAILHAQRLAEMDPLAEQPHRDLMRLYSLSGRRNQALVQYETLTQRLDEELGVEPLKETRELYETIVAGQLPAAAVPEHPLPVGPIVPLVGRSTELARLEASWERALTDGVRLALVEGEAGIGKTRLVRTFLHRATSHRHATILQGRRFDAFPRAFEPFAELLANAVSEHVEDDRERESSPDQLEERIRRLLAGPPPTRRDTVPPDEPEMAATMAALVHSVCRRSSGPPHPVVLFLDGLERTSESVSAVLCDLLRRLTGMPVWIVATLEGGGGSGDLPPALGAVGDARLDRIELQRLADDPVREIARALVEADEADALAAHLTDQGEGLPLKIVELVNLLSDEGLLAPSGEGRWCLRTEALRPPRGAGTLESLVERRVRSLPDSARRLLTLAAVVGQRFDVKLLEAASEEHSGVIEIAIELLLERWLVRHLSRYWTTHPQERDLVLWAHGVRRGTFEFAHPRLRQIVYARIDPQRRPALHRQVAGAYEALAAEEELPYPEELASHHLAAGQWAEALPHLEAAAADAAHLGDRETARLRLSTALAALEQIGEGGDRATLRRHRAELEARLEATARRG